MSQSNTRSGDFPVTAGVDLRGKEGYLVRIGSDSGRAVALLPEKNDEPMLFVLIEGGDVGDTVTLRPLEAGRSVRVRLDGGCEPGALLMVLWDGGHEGKVVWLPEVPGTFYSHLVALESGSPGQLVLAMPVSAFVVKNN
jgi:ribosomal protein L2